MMRRRTWLERNWMLLVAALILLEAVTHGGPTEPTWR
jgi:hypothetical protein